MSRLAHALYITTGMRQVRKGLESLRVSQQESENPLLAAIIREVERSMSMIDGRNEVYPGMPTGGDIDWSKVNA